MQPHEFAIVDAARTIGVQTQKGLLVIRPGYVVFVPTESAINALGAIAGQLAGAAVGVVVRIVPGQYRDVTEYVHALTALDAAAFDAQLAAIWRAAGWWYATPGDAELVFKKVPLFSRFKLGLKRGNEMVGPTFGLAGPIAARVQPLVSAWPAR